MLRYAPLALILLIAGCSPYINIPAQPGDAATHSPNDNTAVAVMEAALAHVLHQRSEPGGYVIALPARASRATYADVLHQLPEGGGRHDKGAVGVPVYSIAAVYVRGPDAQVDIIRPTPAGNPQLISVFLELGVDGWHVVRDRPWSVPVAEAVNLSYPGRDIQ